MSQNGYHIKVDDVDQSEWTTIVNGFADSSLYQTWGYEAVHASEANMSHLLLTQNDAVLGAAQARIVQVPFIRAGIAYIHFGPMWCRRGEDNDPATLMRLLVAIREEYAVKRGLLVRIALNIREDEKPEVRELLVEADYHAQDQMKSYRTFDIDLSPSVEDLRMGLHRRWRNHLNKAEKGELTVQEGTESELFATFLKIYEDLHERKGFEEGVSVAAFLGIQERLPESQKMRVLIASHEGEPCSGIVLTTVGESAVYLLGATTEKAMKLGGSYVLQWRALQWLKENGYQRYDLGGVNKEDNPGVYHFKSGLAGKNPEEVSTFGVWETSAGALSPTVVKCGEVCKKLGKALVPAR